MGPWFRALRWPLLVVVVLPPVIYIAIGSWPTVALVVSLAMPLWYGACAAYAGFRVVARGAGGIKGAALAGLVTASANVVVLCGLVLLWILMPWGSVDNVGVTYFLKALPALLLLVVVVGMLSGWAGGRAALRRLPQHAA